MANISLIFFPPNPKTQNPAAATPLAMNSLSLSSHLLRFKLPLLSTGIWRSTHSLPSRLAAPIPSCHRLSAVIPCATARVRVSTSESLLLKENWLASLSCPFPDDARRREISDSDETDSESGYSIGSGWVIGIDPDVSGALALLRPDCSAEVFDAPHLKVLVGKRERKRLDPKSIVKLIRNFNAPLGTTAYIEQSRPFPQDGKQGWWSGGFSYGMWIGILVASGFTVIPVTPLSWKNYFELSGSSSTKDDSRRAALELFPSLGSFLKRKKDHGRAEALLIAAYGRDVTLKSNSSINNSSSSSSSSSTLTESPYLQVQS